jgi:hypothetical protein
MPWSLRAGCLAGVTRSVLAPSFVPSSAFACLRADAREGRDGTTGGTIAHDGETSSRRASARD